MSARLLRLNSELLRCIERSGHPKRALALVAGFPHYIYLYLAFRDGQVRATPLLVQRLRSVADAVGFPKDEIFLDEAAR